MQPASLSRAAQAGALALYAAGLCGAGVSAALPGLRALLTYGRLCTSDERSTVAEWGTLFVPKRWFTAFYGAGLCVALLASPLAARPLELPLALFSLHLLRRLLECLLVHRFSPDAVMPLHLWLAGLAHYAAVPWTLLPPSIAAHGAGTTDSATCGAATTLVLALCCLLFCVANLQQHRIHRALADLRPPATKQRGERTAATREGSSYALPTGRWFDAAVCPHYSMEVLIYASLAGARYALSACQGDARGAHALTDRLLLAAPVVMVAWVAGNLSATAAHTRAWYRHRFRAAEAALGRRALMWPADAAGWARLLFSSQQA
jgi:hypothetical protein